ncbi:hypothetical protein GR212_15455 [Rhizobium lusitanum]|uniref:Uncharacterized protein n=1 Tax=Rhizobium lusitanum TaxID=293958 RepID=A0A6L9U9L2_9HYPH|nr:hypothetical protein [Rhizobium lusitanum]NEI70976.1 hypothetical protein [Rhizobium lusitanum]
MASIFINNTEYDSETFSSLSREVRVDLMIDWFLQNFEEPGNQLPYDPEEGTYDFTQQGGPFDAKEQLEEIFAEKVPSEEIDQAASALDRRSFDWTRRDPPPQQISIGASYGALSMDASVIQIPPLLTFATETYDPQAFRALKAAKRIALIAEWFEDRYEVSPADFNDRSVLSGERDLQTFLKANLFGYAEDDEVSIAARLLIKQDIRWRPALSSQFGFQSSAFSDAFQTSEVIGIPVPRKMRRAASRAQEYHRSRESGLASVEALATELREMINRSHNMGPDLVDPVIEHAPETLRAAERILAVVKDPEPDKDELKNLHRTIRRLCIIVGAMPLVSPLSHSIIDAAVSNHYTQLETILINAVQSLGRFIGML